MITLLIYVILVLIVGGLFLWAAAMLPLEAPLKQIIRVLIAVVLALIIIYMVVGALPPLHSPSR